MKLQQLNFHLEFIADLSIRLSFYGGVMASTLQGLTITVHNILVFYVMHRMLFILIVHFLAKTLHTTQQCQKNDRNSPH